MNRLAVWITAMALATAPDGAGEGTLVVLFTPDSPGTVELLRDCRRAGLKVRPALLIERWDVPLPDSFQDVVRAAGQPIDVYDREAVRFARELKLRQFPAIVLIRGSSLHVASGSKASVKELIQCH